MKYGLKITKAVATGNDFIIVDNLHGELDELGLDYPALAKELCKRKFSVGADGLLLLEAGKKSGFRMRIINPDGGEVDMCGNGARVSAYYAWRRGMGDSLGIETRAGQISAGIAGGEVKLGMNDPKDIELGMKLGIEKDIVSVNFLNTGVPHVVHIVDSIRDYPVREMGKKIRDHTAFSPEGTNVNFVCPMDDKSAYVRTYERGVEDETLACGTGAVASAVCLALLGMAKSPLTVKTSGGEELVVYLRITPAGVKEVFLQGTCSLVFDAEI